VAIYPARTEGKARGEEQRVRSEAAKRGDGEEEDSKGDRGRGSKPVSCICLFSRLWLYFGVHVQSQDGDAGFDDER